MSTRLGRKVAEARGAYLCEPAELRARFEAGLTAAAECLRSSDEISRRTRKALLEVIAMGFVEGYIGGAWRKVHDALREEAPALYEQVKELLPNAETGDHPLAL